MLIVVDFVVIPSNPDGDWFFFLPCTFGLWVEFHLALDPEPTFCLQVSKAEAAFWLDPFQLCSFFLELMFFFFELLFFFLELSFEEFVGSDKGNSLFSEFGFLVGGDGLFDGSFMGVFEVCFVFVDFVLQVF